MGGEGATLPPPMCLPVQPCPRRTTFFSVVGMRFYGDHSFQETVQAAVPDGATGDLAGVAAQFGTSASHQPTS